MYRRTSERAIRCVWIGAGYFLRVCCHRASGTSSSSEGRRREFCTTACALMPFFSFALLRWCMLDTTGGAAEADRDRLGCRAPGAL